MKGRFWKDCCAEDENCKDCIAHDNKTIRYAREIIDWHITRASSPEPGSAFPDAPRCVDWAREYYGSKGVDVHGHQCFDADLIDCDRHFQSLSSLLTDGQFAQFQDDPDGFIESNLAQLNELLTEHYSCMFWKTAIRCTTGKCLGPGGYCRSDHAWEPGTSGGGGIYHNPEWVTDEPLGVGPPVSAAPSEPGGASGCKTWAIDAILPDGFFQSSKCQACDQLNGAVIRLGLAERLMPHAGTCAGWSEWGGTIAVDPSDETQTVQMWGKGSQISYHNYTKCGTTMPVATACIPRICDLEDAGERWGWWPYSQFDEDAGFDYWLPGEDPSVDPPHKSGGWIGEYVSWPVERWVDLVVTLHVGCNDEDKEIVAYEVGGEQFKEEVKAGTCNMCLSVGLWTGNDSFFMNQTPEMRDIANMSWWRKPNVGGGFGFKEKLPIYYRDENGELVPMRFTDEGNWMWGAEYNHNHHGIMSQTWQWHSSNVKPGETHELEPSFYYDNCFRSAADWDSAFIQCADDEAMCGPRFGGSGGAQFGAVPKTSQAGPMTGAPPVTISWVPAGGG